MKKNIALVLVLAACGAEEEKKLPPPKLPAGRIDLPAGAALKPFDPGKPTLARPEGLVMADNGKLYAALANLTNPPLPEYPGPGGPGLLAEVDPATEELALVDLGTDCTNPQSVAARGSRIYAACTTDYSSGKLAIFDTATREVTRVAVGGGPGALAVGADGTVYLGNTGWGAGVDCDHDGTTAFDEYLIPGTVDVVSPAGAATHTALQDPIVACEASCDARWAGIGDLRMIGGDLYVACLGNDRLARLDPADLRVKSTVIAGDGPQALAEGLEGQVLVANSIAATLSIITPAGDGSMSAQKDVLRLGDVANDIEVRASFAYVVNSGFHTVQKIDLRTLKTVDSRSTLPRSNPWSLAFTSGETTWVTAYELGAVIKIDFAQ